MEISYIKQVMLIPKSVLSNVIQAGLSEGADFCEVYAEESVSSLMEMKSSHVEYIGGKDKGAGIRLFYGNEELYTHTNSLDEKSLLKALKSLSASIKRPFKKNFQDKEPQFAPFTHEFPGRIKINQEKEKAFLQKLDKELRIRSSLISQCQSIMSFARHWFA